MAKGKRKERRIRPDLRSISLRNVEDRIIWEALVDKGVKMSDEFAIFLRGLARRDDTPEARIKFLKTMRKGLSSHYEQRQADLQLEKEQRFAQIADEIELASKELERRSR